ncbi:MAG: hypothetical protein JO252_25225 [Planctomycetaceae bacterium]|nr:hypothetical protein [Planctomycetaceae bacterium]
MCPRESQDQSIKARKHELFEDEKQGSQQGSLKAFSEYLKETPAAPLSGSDKAVLGAVGTLVLFLFLAAISAMIQGPGTPLPSAISRIASSGSSPR